METIPTKMLGRNRFVGKLSVLALLYGTLTFGNVSCGKTTQEDVNEQQKKVESLSFQISHYINSRKQLVEDYNKLLRYPRTESNKSDINRSLLQMYEVITDYDEKIKSLAKDRIEAVDNLNSSISKLEVVVAPDEPLDPNRWDYLLIIQ